MFQISDFVAAKADFGTELAISTRMELDPGDYTRRLSSLFIELLSILDVY